jgi:hypothetical protein
VRAKKVLSIKWFPCHFLPHGVPNNCHGNGRRRLSRFQKMTESKRKT